MSYLSTVYMRRGGGNSRIRSTMTMIKNRFEEQVGSGAYDDDLEKMFVVNRILSYYTDLIVFDPEACDRGVPPSEPQEQMIEEMYELSLYDFETAIASAQLEFIGVFDPITKKALFIDYARRNKGSVSIPVDLLSNEDERYVVTHNHPNCSSFSPADFIAFCDFPSIVELRACTVPTIYSFVRANNRSVIDEENRRAAIAVVETQTKTIVDSTINAKSIPELTKAYEENQLDRFFSCTEQGAALWSEWTDSAWETANNLHFESGILRYRKELRDRNAKGTIGTADVDDVYVLVKRILGQQGVRQYGTQGVSDKVEEVRSDKESDTSSRHKAPYRDDEGFFQPAYDVEQSFPGIYTSSFSKALREYGTGSDSDPESLQIIRNIHNQPEAKVKIYRAVEKGLRDKITDLKQDRKYLNNNASTPPWVDVPTNTTEEYSMFVDSQIENLGSVEGASIQPSINPQDWVTISRQYAVDHGECCVPGDYTILTKTVKAKHLFTEGNSIHEWGYDPSLDETLEGDGFKPPKEMQAEAERGLAWRKEYGRGGTEVGVARARDLSNGRSVSLDTVKRIKAYFDRHQVDKNAEGFRLGEEGYPSAGRIAWALWGGDVGYHWAKTMVAKHAKGLGDVDPEVKIPNVEMPKEQPDEAELPPMTTRDVVSMEPPEALPLTGELREFLTNLLAKFNMLIWGGAGSGKSSFVLRLANELAETNTGRVLYYMTEEKVASGRLKARMDLMKAYSENINFDDHGTFDRLVALVNTGMYRYVIVDSINMINAEQTRIVELMQTFPEVSWIFIAQATKGKNVYAGIQSLAHAVDTEIATANEKGVGIAELKKHRDGPLKTHTIFGNKGMRDASWKKSW